MDPLTIVASITAGILVGLALGYTFFKRKPKPEEKVVARPKLAYRATTQIKSVPQEHLEKARAELNSIMLEKEVLSSAITRVYEAEANNEITKEERERLVEKYREQLDSVNAKLGDLELLIEVGELENLREEVVNLFEQRMGQLERRLDETRSKLQLAKGIAAPVPTLEVLERPEKKVERRKPRAEESEVDKRVKELREEVLEALTRLEQIDLES